MKKIKQFFKQLFCKHIWHWKPFDKYTIDSDEYRYCYKCDKADYSVVEIED